MFKILQNSLFSPKDLLKETKRSWWFVILFIMVLAIFMSLGNSVRFIAYEGSTINDETTNCTLVDNQIVCSDPNNSYTAMFNMYSFRVYFLNADQTVAEIPQMDEMALVFQGDQANIYVSGQGTIGFKVFTEENGFTTISEGVDYLESSLLIGMLIMNYISNLILIVIFILIASLMFSRYKNVMSYGNRFKLATFGSTTIALVMTFYNIISMHFIVFFILIMLAYRTLTAINRELYFRLMQKQMKQQQQNQFRNPFGNQPGSNDDFNKDDVVDSYHPDEVYDESDEDDKH